MSSFNNGTKQASATFNNPTKNSGTIYPYVKGGEGLPYNSPATYDDDLDPISGNPLLYNSAGTTPSYTNLAKS